MDKYAQLRETGQRLCAELADKTTEEAHTICTGLGFALRYYSVNGRACMITADVRMDRISAVVSDGKIFSAQVG